MKSILDPNSDIGARGAVKSFEIERGMAETISRDFRPVAEFSVAKCAASDEPHV
jgi:hypothetical protein